MIDDASYFVKNICQIFSPAAPFLWKINHKKRIYPFETLNGVTSWDFAFYHFILQRLMMTALWHTREVPNVIVKYVSYFHGCY